MRRSLRSFAQSFAFVFALGCTGGSGCSSCGSVTPLPSGVAPASRIENAGSVRITDKGFAFLGQNFGALSKAALGAMAPGGILSIPIPTSQGMAAGNVSYTLCPGGPKPAESPPSCVVEVDFASAKLTVEPSAKYDLHIHGPLPVRVQTLPVSYTSPGNSGITNVEVNGDAAYVGSGPQKFASIDVDAFVELSTDLSAAEWGHGYTRVKVVSLTATPAAVKGAIQLPGDVTGQLLAAITDAAFNDAFDPILSTLPDRINPSLCRQANPAVDPPCPAGTSDVAGVCRYGASPASPCVSLLVGTDGELDLGGLLSSISPGTKGRLDYLFAAGGASPRDDGSGFTFGDLDPIKQGATLGLYGSAEASPKASCVPPSKLELPKGIAVPLEIQDNTVTGWPADLPGPHLGAAISERFANYALAGLYESGALCIGISTESIPLLNSGTLGLIAKSTEDLGLQHEPTQVALTVRLSSPPSVTFGNGTDPAKDPLLLVKLDQASIDFYLFSDDRFVRFMTATFDLSVPVNLTVTPQGLTPVLAKIGVKNGKLSNSALIREKPDEVAASLGDLIAGQVGQFVGAGFKPIDINALLSSLGVSLVIPDSVKGQGSPGLRLLTKGSDSYLGIFASFAAGSPPSPKMLPSTRATLLKKRVDPAGLRLLTITPDNAPAATLHLGSSLDDGAEELEYSYRIDQGFWHPFSAERDIEVSDPWLRAQGRHKVEVRARVVGQPLRLDPTPASVELLVDIEPPVIHLDAPDEGRVSLTVTDEVSGAATELRYRLDGGDWSSWKAASSLDRVEVGGATLLEVEAKDEEGNVGVAAEALIRGRAVATAAGCGCEVAGGDRSSPFAALIGAIGAIGLGARSRRRQR